MKTIKPEELDIDMYFQLTGDACNEEERDDRNIYEVINKDLACEKGAHLIVKDIDEIEREMWIMPWVKVILIEKSKE